MEQIINITNLRKDIYKISESVINDGVIFNVSCKNGSFVVVSKEDYDALLETLYLSENQKIKESIVEGMKAGHDEMISETDVKW